MDDRLPTHLLVTGQLRRCNDAGVPAYVVHKGEKMGGLIMLKLNLLDGGCRVLAQQRDLDGNLGWMAVVGGEAPAAEADADAYIERATARDPDLWVVEIEHKEGWHPFEGKVF